MPYQVINRHGDTFTLEDDQPVPPGCRLIVSPLFMDAQQRSVAENANGPDDGNGEDEDEDGGEQLSEEELRKLQAFIHETMRRKREGNGDKITDAERAAQAYEAYKRRLGTPKAIKYPKPRDPSCLYERCAQIEQEALAAEAEVARLRRVLASGTNDVTPEELPASRSRY